MSVEDRELVGRTLQGDREAFERLVEKYEDMAGAIAGAIGGRASEDLVQDAFLQAFASLRTLRDPRRFRPWLAGIVRAKAIDWLRRKRASPEIRADVSAVPSSRSDRPDDRVEQEETSRIVWEAIEDLAEDYREVLVLRHWGRLSYEEIARITGSTVPAVESRLFRARKALKKRLGGLNPG
jgi:RNA polymerase sigma-70 factor (ECF subfamily)